MWLHALLLLGLAAASDAPSVALLPFGGDVEERKVQTRKLDGWLRASIEEARDEVALLRQTKRDEKDAARCGMDEKCLSDLAFSRGADMLAAGRWTRKAGALWVEVLVVQAKHGASGHRFEMNVDDERRERNGSAARIWRKAFVPSSLLGSLTVSGAPEGAALEIDGVEVGVLPLEKAIDGLLEGEHVVTLRKEGYLPLQTQVEIEFLRQSELRLILVPASSATGEGLAKQPITGATTSAWKTWAPWTLGGAGAGFLLASAATGLSTIWLQNEVEARARKQLLYFPRDEALIQTGQAMALGTNLLLATGLLAVGGAAVSWSWFPHEEGSP